MRVTNGGGEEALSELCSGTLAAEPIPNLCHETARKFTSPILLLVGVGWQAVLWEELGLPAAI